MPGIMSRGNAEGFEIRRLSEGRKFRVPSFEFRGYKPGTEEDTACPCPDRTVLWQVVLWLQSSDRRLRPTSPTGPTRSTKTLSSLQLPALSSQGP